jgi:hypothetical protein
LEETDFKVTPEYVEIDWCEGYAVSWRSWYGFEDCLKHPVVRSFFPLHLNRILEDWLEEGEEMQMIEWIDEDKWEWLNVKKDYAEIFQALYPHDIKVYDEFLSIGVGGRIRGEIRKHDFYELERKKSLYPVFKVLARRGYWNSEGLTITTRRDQFYENIGFDFTLPFK